MIAIAIAAESAHDTIGTTIIDAIRPGREIANPTAIGSRGAAKTMNIATNGHAVRRIMETTQTILTNAAIDGNTRKSPNRLRKTW